MAITERLMGVGKWSLTLSPTVPSWVLDRFDYFSSIVVTRAPVRAEDVGDAGVLDQAVFSGPVTQVPRPDSYQVAGQGNRAWLGDGNGAGDILETAYKPGTPTFANWWSGLLGTIDTVPSPLTAGTITGITAPAAGELLDEFVDLTRLQIATVVSAYYGGEYRCNPDFSVDAAAPGTLFVSSPRLMIVRDPGGTDPNIQSLKIATVSLTQDIDDYTTKVIAVGEGARGADENTSTYYDPQGNTVRRDRLISVDAENDTTAAELATNLLAENDSPRTGLKVSAFGFIPGISFTPGDTIWVHDPETPELVDVSNPVPFRGTERYPVETRALGVTWPLTDGYTVYLRTHNGTTATYTDLSQYVMYEPEGPATIEVGALPRSALPPSATASGHQHPQYLKVVAQRDLDMNSNDITGVRALDLNNLGSNPAETDGPNDYPDGETLSILSSATGWPIGDGWIRTFIDAANAQAHQTAVPQTAGPLYRRFRATSTTWSDWRLVASATDYLGSATTRTLANTNTFERLETLTISDYPSSGFSAAVVANGHTTGRYAASAALIRCRVGVSLDGGTSFTWSPNVRQTNAAGEWGAVSGTVRRAGAVSGDIIVAIDGYSDQLASYDESSLTAVVSPD